MWAIFVSNSNDLAQGYPLFLTLYPEYSYQLFITAALQVAILNPFAILLLEIDLARRTFRDKNEWKEVLKALQQDGKLMYEEASDSIRLPAPAPPPAEEE